MDNRILDFVNSNSYIIQTPVKNEEENLPYLIKSIANQTITPAIWLIIDDGSTDSTPDIINKARQEHEFIETLRLEEGEYDLGLHLSDVTNKGMLTLLDICDKREIKFSFWGNVDGDVTLVENYYEALINEFCNSESLGISSGATWYHKDGIIHHYKANESEPSGGNMLVKKECLFDCNLPLPLTYSWDSAIKTKARIKGWDTKRFDNIKSVDSREVNAVAGYWAGYFKTGMGMGFLNIHPLHAILKSISRSRKYPYYIGIAYLCGYVYNMIIIREKINDDEIKKYNWNKWEIIFKKRFKRY